MGRSLRLQSANKVAKMGASSKTIGARDVQRDPTSAQFAALLAILVFAPLPLGGATIWALALVGAALMAVLIWHLWMRALGRVVANDGAPWTDEPESRARLPLYLMLAWVILIAA